MSRSRLKKLLPLPNPVEPGSEVCARMLVPNAPEYISAVRGQILALTFWTVWERDPLHFGLDTALRMQQAYDSLVFTEQDCNSVPLPDWYLDLNMIQGDYYHDAWNAPAQVIYQGGDLGEVYSLAAWATGTPAELRFDIIGRRRDNQAAVGGQMESIVVANQLDPNGQTFEYQIDACDGTTPGGNLTTPQSLTAGEYRSFSLITGNQTAFMITLMTRRNWTCTP